MTTLKLAPTSFTGGVDDALAAIDIYKQSGDKIINSISDIATIKDLDSLSFLKDGQFNLDNILSNINGKLMLDKNALLNGLLATNPQLMSSLKSLSGGLQDKLLSGDMLSSIMSTIGNVTKMINVADLSTLTGIADMIKSICNGNFSFSFTDIAGIALLASNLIKQATDYEIDNALSSITDTFNDNPEILKLIARNVCNQLLTSPNDNLLKQLSNSNIAKYVIPYNPNFIGTYLQNYEKDTKIIGTSNIDYANHFKLIKDAFNLLNPNWNTYVKKIGNSSLNIINGSDISQASEFFKRSMLAHVDSQFITIDTLDPDTIDTSNLVPNEAYLTLCISQNKSEVRQILKQEFPYSKIKVF